MEQRGRRRASRRMEDLRREETAQSTEGGGDIMAEASGAGLGHQSHPQTLSLRMYTPCGRQAWVKTVERGTKRVNKGEEESAMKHIPGVISLGGEDRNFN